MIIADINVRFSTIDVILRDKLPCGAAGLKVRFRFMDPAWKSLSKIAVFRNRSQTLDVAIVEDCATIPHELLAKVLDVIDVGVYGTDGDKMLGIPTLWGSLGTVASAADPSGDASMDPTLPYWALLKEQVDMLENTILGNDDPESVRVSVLRTSGGKMSGSIEMCGNMVTGLGTPGDNTDAVNLEYANRHFRSNTWLPTAGEISAAPAGFGLGEVCVVQGWDGITKTGFYKGAPGPVFGVGEPLISDFWYGYHIDAGVQNYAVQRANHYYYGGCTIERTRKSDGTWTEWEWVNPPMELGVEYRTTERWNGKVVYTKLIDFGSLPAASTKHVATGSPATKIVSFSGISKGATGTRYLFPMIAGGAVSAYAFIASADGSLSVTTLDDRSSYTAQFVVKYIKD